ncbi:MAG: hypothetical protein JW857_00115 [Bacteroidales bacterium]|nr:hypothetical protein [Bacteroidales bacterium]
MRIWTIHPKYLDTKGLLALWRETLLAKHVLEGKTKGYKNHPQLERFKLQENPINCIQYYLKHIWIEATQRTYQFDKSKFDEHAQVCRILVTTGQVAYERQHLLNKLALRDPLKFKRLEKSIDTEIHPIFELIKGDIEQWEHL